MKDTQAFIFIVSEKDEESEFFSSVDNARIPCFLTKEKIENSRKREAVKNTCRFEEFTLTSKLESAFRVFYALVNKTTADRHIKNAIREDDNYKLYVIADRLFAKAIAHQLNLKIVKINIM